MDIVFLNAPNKGIKVEPLNLEYLHTYLKYHAVNSVIIDSTIDGLSDKEITELLIGYNPKFICLSLTTFTLKEDIYGIKLAKRACPEAKIIVGGPHPSAEPVSLMNAVKGVDYAVVGEGEETLLALINAVGKNKPLSKVLGICYRKQDKIILNKRRPLIKNLDSLPIPSREFINFNKVRATIPFGRKKPFSIVTTARGCPYKCVFCSKSVFNTNYRHRSVENIISELDYLQSIGVKEIRFYDDVFTLVPSQVEKLCNEMIKRKYTFIWSCEARVNGITEELLRLMKKAGCYNITYGVESGSQKVLDIIKKNITLSEVRNAFSMAKKVGLETSALFMIGLPGETKETLKETFAVIKEINADFTNVGITSILPKTELLEIAKKEGLTGEINWYSFIDERISPVTVGCSKDYIPAGMTKKELMSALKKFYISYYLNPKRIYRIIKIVKNFKVLFYGFKMMLDYVLNN